MLCSFWGVFLVKQNKINQPCDEQFCSCLSYSHSVNCFLTVKYGSRKASKKQENGVVEKNPKNPGKEKTRYFICSYALILPWNINSKLDQVSKKNKALQFWTVQLASTKLCSIQMKGRFEGNLKRKIIGLYPFLLLYSLLLKSFVLF